MPRIYSIIFFHLRYGKSSGFFKFWWSFVDEADLAGRNPAAVTNNVQRRRLPTLAGHELPLRSAGDPRFCKRAETPLLGVPLARSIGGARGLGFERARVATAGRQCRCSSSCLENRSPPPT